ncbi:hypothetical protein CcaCcLH18_10647 [Colletotrichum camelliae]|nr:hypothetical protein CcaCcLH18_10647 [Colletotrichum camelliae]
MTQNEFTGGVKLDEDGKFFTDHGSLQYVAPPSPEVDKAWGKLLSGLNIDLESPELEGRTFRWPETGLYFTGLEVFHSLHCLNRLRQALHPDYYDVFADPHDPSREDHIEGAQNGCPFYARLKRAMRSFAVNPSSPVSVSMSFDELESDMDVAFAGSPYQLFRTLGDPINDIVKTRLPNLNVSAEKTAVKSRVWIADCLANHPACTSKDIPEGPTRLLKLDKDDQTVCLVSNDKNMAYATFSYCWGGDQEHKLTMARLSSYQTAIPVTKLPKSIQDAITVIRTLHGISYVWVDSLCIVQDDKDDRDRALAKMGDIYSGSIVTIWAANAESCEDGFLGIQSDGGVYIDKQSSVHFDHDIKLFAFGMAEKSEVQKSEGKRVDCEGIVDAYSKRNIKNPEDRETSLNYHPSTTDDLPRGEQSIDVWLMELHVCDGGYTEISLDEVTPGVFKRKAAFFIDYIRLLILREKAREDSAQGFEIHESLGFQQLEIHLV